MSASGSARVVATDRVRVYAVDAVHVTASGEAEVSARGNATVEASGDAEVLCYEYMNITATGNARSSLQRMGGHPSPPPTTPG